MRRAAMMPMIATTISSSISVKPRSRFLIFFNMNCVLPYCRTLSHGQFHGRFREGYIARPMPQRLSVQTLESQRVNNCLQLSFDKKWQAWQLLCVSGEPPHHRGIEVHPLDEAGERHPLVGGVDLEGVGRHDEEGGEAIGGDARLAEEARVGRRPGKEHGARRGSGVAGLDLVLDDREDGLV